MDKLSRKLALAQALRHFVRKGPQMKCDFFPEPRQAKEKLRQSMRETLRAMGPALRAEASLVLCTLAGQLPAFAEAKCIALYSPLPTEPDIRPLIEEAWAHGKQVVLPRMIRNGKRPELEWHAVGEWGDVVEPVPLGLREPDPIICARVHPGEVDCAFIPGVAFDGRGFRLGRGGGYYDCFLSGVRTDLPRFGLMFSCQRVLQVPHEPHDQALPCVVTEDGMVKF
jgi:5-formyltetrahydrofolate cyclo-ligase